MDRLGKKWCSVTNVCEWCYSVGASRCGRCHIAYYCSREHQLLHWSEHRKVCKKPPALEIPVSVNAISPSTSSQNFTSQDWCQNKMVCSLNEGLNPMTPTNTIISTNIYSSSSCNVTPQKPVDFISNEDIFSSLSSENNFWDLINSCDTQTLANYDMYLERDTVNQISEPHDQNFASCTQVNDRSSSVPDVDMQCAPLNDICSNVVHDMNLYGICVLDNFIGANYGNVILQEVKSLYMKGIFTKGELLNPNPYELKGSVRNDVITWVNGNEPDCKHIGNLIKKLDVVVTTSNKMPNNGFLSKYKLHRRTKAMVACYPGDGTYYKKHVDNPNKDGRCITCIYYLNQNWDTKTHGGLLRMFPAAQDSQVANIEPIFDRMIFFWSDKRNPHEVLPSYATRFAITVWYFDADERDRAVMTSRENALKKSQKQPFIS